jgi:ribosomal protein S18 acetylase RimI-like enzyme
MGLVADPFLEGILGKPAWRADLPVDADAIGALRGANFVHAKAPSSDVASVGRLEALGFRVVDANITLERPSDGLAAAGGREATPEDRDAVVGLAGKSFQFSRFHLDPAIPRAAADRSRAEWVGNFFTGSRGDAMLVAERGGDCAGFILLLGPKDGVLTIDLIATASEHRRKGVARELMTGAAALPGTRTLRVGTQLANVPSLRLYEGEGFRIVATQYVLHCHRP